LRRELADGPSADHGQPFPFGQAAPSQGADADRQWLGKRARLGAQSGGQGYAATGGHVHMRRQAAVRAKPDRRELLAQVDPVAEASPAAAAVDEAVYGYEPTDQVAVLLAADCYNFSADLVAEHDGRRLAS
jgi:hypothetical protein